MDECLELDTSGPCCGIKQLTGVYEDTKPKSIKEILEDDGDGKYVIATTVSGDNTRALRTNRFKVLARFRNPSTRNMVTLWGKRI